MSFHLTVVWGSMILVREYNINVLFIREAFLDILI